MGVMMILVAQLESVDGVVQVEPSNYGIVLELEHREGIEDWLDDKPYELHDDAREYREELLKSNQSINFASSNEMVRMLREATDE